MATTPRPKTAPDHGDAGFVILDPSLALSPWGRWAWERSFHAWRRSRRAAKYASRARMPLLVPTAFDQINSGDNRRPMASADDLRLNLGVEERDIWFRYNAPNAPPPQGYQTKGEWMLERVGAATGGNGGDFLTQCLTGAGVVDAAEVVERMNSVVVQLESKGILNTASATQRIFAEQLALCAAIREQPVEVLAVGFDYAPAQPGMWQWVKQKCQFSTHEVLGGRADSRALQKREQLLETMGIDDLVILTLTRAFVAFSIPVVLADAIEHGTFDDVFGRVHASLVQLPDSEEHT